MENQSIGWYRQTERRYLPPRSVPCPYPSTQVRREYLSHVQGQDGICSASFSLSFLWPFISLLLFLSLTFSSFIYDFHPLLHLQNYLLWNMITSGLFNFFKSFIDSFRFAFLFQESKECFQIPPIVLQKPPFSYHISNQTLVLKYLSFLIDFGVLMFWQKFLRKFFKNYYL